MKTKPIHKWKIFQQELEFLSKLYSNYALVSRTPAGWDPWKSRSKNCPRREKYPEISSPLKVFIKLSSLMGKHIRYWGWITNLHWIWKKLKSPPIKSKRFSIPVAKITSFILYLLVLTFSPGHWDREWKIMKFFLSNDMAKR